MCLKDELLEFLYSQFGTNKYGIIQSRLTRKLIKLLFIPLIYGKLWIYGKTIMTMGSNIHEDYGSLLRKRRVRSRGIITLAERAPR